MKISNLSPSMNSYRASKPRVEEQVPADSFTRGMTVSTLKTALFFGGAAALGHGFGENGVAAAGIVGGGAILVQGIRTRGKLDVDGLVWPAVAVIPISLAACAGQSLGLAGVVGSALFGGALGAALALRARNSQPKED